MVEASRSLGRCLDSVKVLKSLGDRSFNTSSKGCNVAGRILSGSAAFILRSWKLRSINLLIMMGLPNLTSLTGSLSGLVKPWSLLYMPLPKSPRWIIFSLRVVVFLLSLSDAQPAQRLKLTSDWK